MRKSRVKIPNSKYHVTARVNRQEKLFADTRFKNLLLSVIKQAKKKHSFLFTNFCIMDNHIHLDIEPLGATDLSRIMQWILSVFARKYNITFKYKGHVWYDRFKSKVIQSIRQYLNTLVYIANNPVRANIVTHPLHYHFSGLYFHVHKLDPGLLDPLPAWITKYIDKFLANFKPEESKIIIPEYSFRDKKPGRPKKT